MNDEETKAYLEMVGDGKEVLDMIAPVVVSSYFAIKAEARKRGATPDEAIQIAQSKGITMNELLTIIMGPSNEVDWMTDLSPSGMSDLEKAWMDGEEGMDEETR